MKAAIHHRHGPACVLRVEDVPEPTLGADEVLIRVRAAGLNRLDLLQRDGPPLLPNFTLPHIPGMDVAGEIAQVGPGVSGIAVGERVVVNPAVNCGRCQACVSGDDGMCPNVRVVGGNRPGGFAEWCVVPETHVYPIPRGVSYTSACAIPTNYSTAWHGLFVTGELRLGETVMLHGAGSGVTIAAIQLAKRAGARVMVTSGSDSKLEVARRVGADGVVNHTTQDLIAAAREMTDGKGVDMVFDHVGPALFQTSLHALRPHGRLVFCGTTTGVEACFNLPHAYHFGIALLGADPYRYAEFASMLRYCWNAGIEPLIDSEFELSEFDAAQARMENGACIGKVVVHP